MIRFILPVLALILLSGCATSRDVETVQYEMDLRMEKRVNQLEEQISETRRILDSRIAEENRPVRTAQADLWAEIETLRVNVATLQGRVDEFEQRLPDLQMDVSNATRTTSALKSRVDQLEKELNMVVSQLGLGQTLPGEAPQANATDVAPAEDPPAAVTTPTSPESLYDNALAAFNKRDYQKAQSLWAEFVRRQPGHKLVPNALFWQGESFYQLKDYNRAVLAYQEVIERFPDSNKYPSSLLKQGLSFFELGKDKAGRLLLEEVVSKFPQSAEARRAKLFLQNR